MDISMSKTRMTVAITLSTLAICLTIATNPATSQARPVTVIATAELEEPSKYKDVSKKKLEQERIREENTVVVSNDAKIKVEMAEVTVTPPPPPPPPEPEPEVPEAPASTQDTEPQPEPEVVEVSHQVETQPPPEPQTSSGSASAAVAIAMTKVGFPYVYGSGGPSSFDCSGLISWAYAQVGISLPHQSAAMLGSGTQVSTPAPGDIVYTPGHVALYAGDGMVVEAATPATGVVYRPMWQDNPIYIRVGA